MLLEGHAQLTLALSQRSVTSESPLLLLILTTMPGLLWLQEPYYYAWTNHLRVGCYAATAFVALMNAIMVWPDNRADPGRAWLITLLALTILPAALLIGIALSWARLRLSVNRALHAFR